MSDSNSHNRSNGLKRLAGSACALALPACSRLLDFRVAHYDRSCDPARPEYNEHCVFVFWHEYIGVLLPNWGQTPLTLLVSQHRDAEILNHMAVSLGLNIVRGSTTRGGTKAIRELKRFSRFSSIAISPDGPKGPRREMASGALFLASMLKMPIVPVGIGIDRPKRLSTWDKFAIPRPFSRVRVVFGPKFYLPARLRKAELPRFRALTQTRINQLTTFAENWAETGNRVAGESPFVRARRTGQLFFPKPTRIQTAIESQTASARAA